MSYQVWKSGFDHICLVNPSKSPLHVLHAMVKRNDKFFMVNSERIQSVDGALLYLRQIVNDTNLNGYSVYRHIHVLRPSREDDILSFFLKMLEQYKMMSKQDSWDAFIMETICRKVICFLRDQQAELAHKLFGFDKPGPYQLGVCTVLKNMQSMNSQSECRFTFNRLETVDKRINVVIQNKPTCYRCNKEGHFKRKCTFCRYCKTNDGTHPKSDCYVNKRKNQGHPKQYSQTPQYSVHSTNNNGHDNFLGRSN